MNPSDQRGQNTSPSSSPSGCLSIIVRLGWIFGGILLFFCALFIAQGKNPVVSDVIFIIFTLVLILLRFIDIRFLKGETMDNQPATMAHWRGYALKMLIVSVLLYVLARIGAGSGLLR